MVDHLNRDPPRFRFLKRPGSIAVQGLPGILVDLSFQRGLERFVGIIGTQKIGMPNKEGFFVFQSLPDTTSFLFKLEGENEELLA